MSKVYYDKEMILGLQLDAICYINSSLQALTSNLK